MTPTASERPPSGRGRPWLRWLAPAFFLAACLGGAAWWLTREEALPEPPSVPLDGVEPAVAQSLEMAADKVRRSPRSGAAWGHLGMVLGAYSFRDQSVVCFATAERLEPREPSWPYYRGLTLQLN